VNCHSFDVGSEDVPDLKESARVQDRRDEREPVVDGDEVPDSGVLRVEATDCHAGRCCYLAHLLVLGQARNENPVVVHRHERSQEPRAGYGGVADGDTERLFELLTLAGGQAPGRQEKLIVRLEEDPDIRTSVDIDEVKAHCSWTLLLFFRRHSYRDDPVFVAFHLQLYPTRWIPDS